MHSRQVKTLVGDIDQVSQYDNSFVRNDPQKLKRKRAVSSRAAKGSHFKGIFKREIVPGTINTSDRRGKGYALAPAPADAGEKRPASSSTPQSSGDTPQRPNRYVRVTRTKRIPDLR